MKKKVKPVAGRESPAARKAAKLVKVKAVSRARISATPRSATKPARTNVAPVAAPATAAVPAVATAPANDAFHLKLDASCTLRETADLQFSLVAARGDPLVVDGGGVERIDTSGLQLLVALARRQQAAGRLEWKAASPELLKCGARLGLLEVLGLAGLAAGETP